MSIINKVGDTLSHSVDVIKEKNRKAAYLNRLKAVIRSEEDLLQQAFAALGKQYFNLLEGKKTGKSDTAELTRIIRDCKERLQRARERYDYAVEFGVPEEEEEPVPAAEEQEAKEAEDAAAEEDITIAYAAPGAEASADDSKEPKESPQE